MTWTRVAIGAPATSFNASNTAGLPAGVAAGDTLVYCSTEFHGSDSIPDLSAYGFALASSAVNGHTSGIWLKTAVGGDTMPTINWGNQFQYSVCVAYRGGDSGSLTPHAATDRYSTSRSSIAMPGATITNNGCLLLSWGTYNKISTPTNTDAATIGDFGSFTQIVTQWPSGTFKLACVLSEWIQTAATSVTQGGHAISISDTAASAPPTNGLIIALNAAAAPPSGTMPDWAGVVARVQRNR